MSIKLRETDKIIGEIVSVTKDASGVDVETVIGYYVNEAQRHIPEEALVRPVPSDELPPEWVREQIVQLSRFSSERKEILTKGRGDRDILGDYPETPACLTNAERSIGLALILRLQNIKSNK